ncbi:MAG: pabB [Herbaspirillum sp.]|nr:pabB [Herbaspirillum sp.]
MNDCFALLEDSNDRADPGAAPRSRLYTGYSRTLRCDTAQTLPRILAQLQSATAQGEYALMLMSYELGAQQHRIAPFPGAAATMPAAEILLFRQCRHLSAAEVEHWLRRQDQTPAYVINRRADVGRTEFDDAIARIKAYIAAGDCYQVNYTYRLHFDLIGAPVALYRKLRERQPTRYGALIALPDGRTILSCSPELFLRHQGGKLTVQPMKGTVAASGDADIDAQRAAALAADPKNRAENLMIVDLLRNDLGRVAQTGTVQVRELFQVQHFKRVLQMTSTVQASIAEDTTLPALIEALYPCGSITGAPKLRAMQIIRELENAPRGIYTGALGWFDAAVAPHAIGDFCLSVPIRTLMLDAARQGLRHGQMGVGAGIVHDSIAADEYEECQLKARFLTELPQDFLLFETIHATGAAGCRHIERHLQRLGRSAAACGFACDIDAIRQALQRASDAIIGEAPHRLRLTLAHNGDIAIAAAPLTPLQEPVRLFIAPRSNDSGAFFTAHKTTVRQAYDRAWQDAEQRGGFDQVFLNADGYLTEGGRSNVFLRLQNRWYTPPLQAGVLPGVMRAVLLADAAWNATERNLTLDDLRHAEDIVVCNALRGALHATVDWETA